MARQSPGGRSGRGAGLTPLVGREQEIGLLVERWAQVEGRAAGRVVLLSGEAGIGKSRLVAGAARTGGCGRETPGVADAVPVFPLSPAQCLVSADRAGAGAGGAGCFDREESPPQKLNKLEGFLVQYGPAARQRPCPLCRPALPPTPGGLCAPAGDIAGAAEAADLARPADDLAGNASPPSSPCFL